MISKFLSLFKTNFYLSASISAATSLAHCPLSIPCSLNFLSLAISDSLTLFSFYQVRILTVSWTFFFFSAASVFSLWTFLSWSNIHNLAYTYSSTIYYSSLAFLSINCFSLSMLQPATMNWVSSLLRSSVSILNFLSMACWTTYCLSSSLWALISPSLSAILALTCSGVSKLSWNSFSYMASSCARRTANLYLRPFKSDCCLLLISDILFFTIWFLIKLSDLASHLALRNTFLSPLIAFFNEASLNSASLLWLIW